MPAAERWSCSRWPVAPGTARRRLERRADRSPRRHRLGYPQADRDDGLYGYNAALLGALLVTQLGLSGASPVLVGVAALASCPLQAWLLARLRHHGGLPGFTLPFVLIGLLALLCIAPVSVSSPDVPAPDATTLRDAWLLGIGRGLLHQPLAAACVLAAVAPPPARCPVAAGGLGDGVVGCGPVRRTSADGQAGFNPALAALAPCNGVAVGACRCWA